MLISNILPTPSQLKWLREAAHLAHDDVLQGCVMCPRGLMTQGQLDQLRLRSLSIFTLLNTFEKPSAELLADNHGAALAYTLFRKGDAARLSSELYSLPYAKITVKGEDYYVNEYKCSSLVCACAYILAKWW
jgi:hypothetical protein